MAKKTVEDIDLKGKKVLVRADFNVPVKDDAISDDTRIKAALPTIKYVVQHGGKAILFSHLGRVKTEEDKEGKSLAPVAKRLGELLDKDVKFVPETRGKKLEDAIDEMQDGEIVVFENTRFEDIDGKKESKNDPELGKYWASLGDVFVNDAFGTAHRSHASNVGIASTGIPTVAGFLMEKEIKFIGEAVDDPKRPMIAILGGAKVSDKIGVIENLIEKADKILIGGGMTYTFYKAEGKKIGNSLVEEDKVELAKSLIEKAGDKLVLPVDSVTAEEFSNDVPTEIYEGYIPDDRMGLDIGPKTVELFSNILKDAQTVVWNGPMGVFEMSNFAKGTIGVCQAIADLKNATTIIGGGDSAAAAESLGFADKFTHISTGGGASLELLEGRTLPGLAAINDK
ncbi:phosphoglycerate kinase [Tetragenococcus solitarius]|uniref:Phosphoglycerate kinase n=1 Tax=Tetragenococcus solitarius TaxID=71453 RepID=A0ABP6KLW4_9ENTE|nr:phosphoglycerate kinase [Tetragenococcus solitarius]